MQRVQIKSREERVADGNRRRLNREITAWREITASMKAPAAHLPGRRNAFSIYDQVPPGVVPKEHLMAADEFLKERADWASKINNYAYDQQQINVLPWPAQFGLGSGLANGYGFLGFNFLAELTQIPEYRVISETIAQETTREWIELRSTGGDPDKGPKDKEKAEKRKKIEDELDRLHVRDAFRAACAGDGFFGRGHLYLDTGDTDDLTELLTTIGDGRNEASKAKVSPDKPLQAVRPVEAMWCYPTDYDSINPLKADWYRPRTWFAMGNQLHRTRLLTFIGRPLPDILKPAYAFGGISLSQQAQPYVNNFLRTRQAVSDLVWSFNDTILMTDLQTLLQDAGSSQGLLSRIQAMIAMRTNNGVLAINKTSEDWKKIVTPLGGLDALQAQSQEHMSAVSRIPLVKLLGITPSGLNASSDGEIRVFYDTISAYQEALFRQHLTTIIDFIQLSLWGEIDQEITFVFKPLWKLDEAGNMAIQETKAHIYETYAALGVVGPETIKEAVALDPASPFASVDLEDAELPEQEVPGEEMEGGLMPPEGEKGNVTPMPSGGKSPTDRLATSIVDKSARSGGASGEGFGGAQ